MEKYEKQILENLEAEFKARSVVELPELVRVTLFKSEWFASIEERGAYLSVHTTDNEFNILSEVIIGFGETGGNGSGHWAGNLHWEAYLNGVQYGFGTVANGSPNYVVWELFDSLDEQLRF
jgi:hypothetical protein